VNGVLITVWLCGAIAVAVFVAMIVSTATHGRSRRGTPKSMPGQATEILWTMIPIAIVLAAAIPALRTIEYAGGAEAARSEFHPAAPRPPISAFTRVEPSRETLKR
jgi:heme/copper-type cytochrome/quinol oxidase subunit 2